MIHPSYGVSSRVLQTFPVGAEEIYEAKIVDCVRMPNVIKAYSVSTVHF